jgi:hypothetical protein
MTCRNPHVAGWIKDISAAIAAAVVAYPVVGALWTGEIGKSFVGVFRMQPSEWFMLTIALFIPSALLGVIAARLVRWRFPERAPGAAIAATAAFAVSATTSLAFLWWLSKVL